MQKAPKTDLHSSFKRWQLTPTILSCPESMHACATPGEKRQPIDFGDVSSIISTFGTPRMCRHVQGSWSPESRGEQVPWHDRPGHGNLANACIYSLRGVRHHCTERSRLFLRGRLFDAQLRGARIDEFRHSTSFFHLGMITIKRISSCHPPNATKHKDNIHTIQTLWTQNIPIPPIFGKPSM